MLPRSLGAAGPGERASEEGPGFLSPAVRSVLVVLAATAATLLARWSLSSVLKDDSAFLPFIFPVMLSSWYGGFRVGALATFLGATAACFFFVRPFYTLPEQTAGYAVQLTIFLAIGLLVSVLNEAWHRARRRLTAHEEFLATVLEANPTGVLVLDPEGYVTFVNSAAAALFGLGSGLLVGRPWSEIGLVSKAASGRREPPSLDDLQATARPEGSLRLLVEDAATARVEVETRVTHFRLPGQASGCLVLALVPVETEGAAHV